MLATHDRSDCSDGCQLTHQTTGQTNMVVTVVWGAGSTAGTCVEPTEFPQTCTIIKNCEFDAYEVKVTGVGTIQWRNDNGGFGKKTALNGDASRRFGDAANPVERLCGDGRVDVYFPDDLAGGGGPHCSACN